MTFQFIKNYLWLIPILPLVGALINGIFGAKFSKKTISIIACLTVFISFIISCLGVLYLRSLPIQDRSITNTLYTWINLGGGNFPQLKVDIAFLLDPLSAVMILVVTGVGFLIHLYSIGYMWHDEGFWRYFSFLNLFAGMMLILVLGNSLLLMFIGWEGVGLCSYLLISFWYKVKANTTAGNKAFIVNRIGDLGFIIGIFLLFWSLGKHGVWTVNFKELAFNINLLKGDEIFGISTLTIIGICLFIGACGKSAQIPLYVWLPDAMAGPTPVSALIHAATMVTAGVYMIGRLNFLYILTPTAMAVVMWIGVLTAFFSATIGLAQNDIKKVLAYSTVSQLGYMFLAMGVGAFSAGIFHLTTHSFFKACLFLGSGSVIHAMSGEQDIRKMGGLASKLKITFITFLLATIAIAGVFPFAGFFSKDEILWKTFEGGHYIPWLIGMIGAFLTAFYMLRLLSLTFLGKCRADEEVKAHIHEAPFTMTFPLIILGILSLIGGFLGVPHALGKFYNFPNLIDEWLSPLFKSGFSLIQHEIPKELAKPHNYNLEYSLMIISVIIALLGIFSAYIIYGKKRELPEKWAKNYPVIYALLLNKYYVDEIYQKYIVNNVLRLVRFLGKFDLNIIDGIVNGSAFFTTIFSKINGWFDNTFVDGLVNLTANSTILYGKILRKLQTGKIQNYLYTVLFGVVVIMFIAIIRSGI